MWIAWWLAGGKWLCCAGEGFSVISIHAMIAFYIMIGLRLKKNMGFCAVIQDHRLECTFENIMIHSHSLVNVVPYNPITCEQVCT